MRTCIIQTEKDWGRLRPLGYCRRPPTAGIGEPTPPVDVPRRTILLGDATERLGELPANSVDTCITSPPYYALRDYSVPGQIGLEATVDDWVENVRRVLDRVARVLKPAGSLWLNLGDSFSKHKKYGAPPKSMLAAPERLLLALMEGGWILRSKVIWHKPNGLPNSVADRLNVNYEVVYFLVRSPQYFFDLDAIREPHRSVGKNSRDGHREQTPAWAGPLAAGSQDGLKRARPHGEPGNPLGKNPGSVWTIPTYGYRGPHFATFPPRLVERPLLATCPEAICSRCGRPWRRRVSVKRVPVGPPSKAPRPMDRQVMRFSDRWNTVREVGDLVPCGCEAPTVPGVVIDPFLGAGTVGLVAESLGRDWLGVELSPAYRDLALERIIKARGRP